MARYIDAHRVENLLTICGNYHGVIWLESVKSIIHDVSTENVVKVVRCKDCRHHIFDGDRWLCKLLSNNYEPVVEMDDDGYCSCGERMEAEE